MGQEFESLQARHLFIYNLEMFYLSAAATFLSLLIFTEFKQIFVKYLFLILIFLNLSLLGVYRFFDFLSGNGFNEAVIFHLIHGINGFGINEYIFPSFLLFIYLIFVILILISGYKKILHNSNQSFIKDICIIGFISVAILLNPFLKDLKILIKPSLQIDTLETGHFYDKQISFTKNPTNIIFLYLEQLERTYMDEKIFPDLTPNLKRLEREAISFTNISSPYATNWTIAGMVASQCGIPLLTPIASENSMVGMDKFLSSATCIGDILSNNSYNLSYIGGSDLDFAGKGKFYESHGFNSIQGWYELENRLISKSYKSPWGLYDDSLYEILNTKLKEVSLSNQSFGLFSLTLDTHHPYGYMSNFCGDMKYKDGKNLILNSVHCADLMASNFIDNFLNDELFENTILVVLSDHLALKNTATSKLETQDRKNLFYIFKKNAPSQLITKTGSMLDVAPTVLSLVGTNIRGLGLGRNLFFEKSLSENESGIENIIVDNRSKILSLWSFPQIDNDFKINLQDKKLVFGSRDVDYPALILLNNNKVEEIMFDFYFANPLPRKANELSDKQSFIWVDTCERIQNFKNIQVSASKNYCALLGIKNHKDYEIIYDLENFNNDQIFNFFNKSKQSFFKMN